MGKEFVVSEFTEREVTNDLTDAQEAAFYAGAMAGATAASGGALGEERAAGYAMTIVEALYFAHTDPGNDGPRAARMRVTDAAHAWLTGMKS